MNKNAIKKYAIWARNELIDRVSHRAAVYGITDEDHGDMNADSVNGSILTVTEKRQRQALIRKVNAQGYQIVMEEVAFTWFNRFAALRFMEVNGYLPSHVRVFTNDEGEFKPQILTEAIHLELDGLDKGKVFALEKANQREDLFKYLLITQCNALSAILPGLFQKIDDYTELLLPDFLLREGSVIQQMVELIPEKDWTDQVQIIGWLYQYYNTEPKDKVFGRKSGEKIKKEEIPAATQLFTPDWIVRYMVENSLGRIFIDKRQNEGIYGDGRGLDEMTDEEYRSDRIAAKSEIAESMGWKYFIPEALQESKVEAQLKEIRKEYTALKPEDIRVIDPCMGSGHILCYLFDVLVQIYEAYGYSVREAVRLIVEKNLYGLDLDERAGQLAYFAVMMKARQYDRRFFSRDVQPNIGHFQGLSYHPEDFPSPALQSLVKAFENADEYGSLLEINDVDIEAAANAVDAYTDDFLVGLDTREKLLRMVQLARMMSQKYDVVVTNPPYMGGSGMDNKLSQFVKKKYPDSKSDLSTCFMERCESFCEQYGYFTMINIPVWMFLTSFEDQRKKIVEMDTFSSLLHFGRGIFGADFGTVSFVIRKGRIKNFLSPFLRLFDKPSSVDSLENKKLWFFEKKGLYYIQQESFERISGTPIAYWVSPNMLRAFDLFPSLGKLCDPRQGLITGDNDRFLREWYEIEKHKINQKWFVYNKGGEYRKWYGNNDLVVNWENNGQEITTLINPDTGRSKSRPQNVRYYFKEGFTWTTLSIGAFSARFMPKGQIFDAKGSSCFADNTEKIKILLALTNSCVSTEFFKILSPTVDYSAGSIAKLPVSQMCFEDNGVIKIIDECIDLSKYDWDSFETSWDFCRHPLIRGVGSVEEAFAQWQAECSDRFHQLKANEEELNRIFIDIYGLQDELTPEVEDKDVTVRKADLQREIKSLISYAVGCMFGRYSLDVDGLAYAGGDWDSSKYVTFQPDKDGILPITDDEYFEDDIVALFVRFIETVYGRETLEENLKFIANALTANSQRLTAKSPREIIRNYFITDFFADHCKIYQKRPIYWLFDSGKKNGFKCLIYLHRYRRDTVARVRTDYVHELQSRYRTAMADLEKRIASASTSDKVRLTKQLATMQGQADELRAYEEKIHHLADRMMEIDLDDGVKHNYDLFKDVLAKIK